MFFFFKMQPAATWSSYVSETNLVAKVIESAINRNPCIALALPVVINRTFPLIPSIPGDDPLSNGQIGLFKTQLTERKI
jgi:hypothetical protein